VTPEHIRCMLLTHSVEDTTHNSDLRSIGLCPRALYRGPELITTEAVRATGGRKNHKGKSAPTPHIHRITNIMKFRGRSKRDLCSDTPCFTGSWQARKAQSKKHTIDCRMMGCLAAYCLPIEYGALDCWLLPNLADCMLGPVFGCST
jgi:hypothetical protein